MLTEQYPFLDSPSEESLLRLIEDGVAESHLVEFKQDLPKANDTEDKREFLADVTAFANAGGGMIVYGMRAEGGRATELCGISCADADHEAARLKDTIHGNVEPALLGLRFVPVKLNSGRTALVVQVPSSWNGPHMITESSRVNSRFWIRVSNGKQQMDIGGLRSAFLRTRDLNDEIRRFRDQRLGKILARETPVALEQGPLVALHLIPLRTTDDPNRLDVTVFEDVQLCATLTDSFIHRHFSLDGYVVYGYARGGPTWHYKQVFRNGVIESATKIDVHDDQGVNRMSGDTLESNAVREFSGMLAFASTVQVEPPLLATMALLGVKGLKFHHSRLHIHEDDPDSPMERDIMVLPESLLLSYDRPAPQILRPMLDAIWNAAGWKKSRGYDANGNWNPDRR